MERTIIENQLKRQSAEDLRLTLSNIFNTYCTPSFGSMSKHDIDLLLFHSMISLGIIKKDPSIYDVMKELKVTRSKARNLIYEYQLRKVESEDTLNSQLLEILKKPLLSSNTSYVLLEIDNPYLIDYVRNELKKMGHITDGSFHSEMVKMSADAFSELYETIMPYNDKKKIRKKLTEYGVKKDISIKALFPQLILGLGKTLGKSVFGKVGEDIAEESIKYLSNHIAELKETYKDMFQ